MTTATERNYRTTPATAEEIKLLVARTKYVEGAYAVLMLRGDEIWENQSGGWENMTADQISYRDAQMGAEFLAEHDRTLPVHIYGTHAVVGADSFGQVSGRCQNHESGWIRNENFVLEAFTDVACSLSTGVVVIGEGKIAYADNFGYKEVELSDDGASFVFTGRDA